MNNLGEYIGQGFERLLRWFYPGALFVVLLSLSRPDIFASITEQFGFPEHTIWGLLIFGLGVGFAIYLFQQYVITQTLSALSQLLRWDPNIARTDQPRTCCLRVLAQWIDPQARVIEKQYKDSNYIDYSWATYHATSMTGWLLLVFIGIKTDSSLLSKAGCWSVIPALFLILGSLYLFARLSRVKNRTSGKTQETASILE